ncbi:MAG: hypothetical protein ABJB04_06380 [Betaproteobacteria bacterium]
MERVDVMLEPVRAFLVQIGAFLPRLAVALMILLIGVLLAKLSRIAIVKGLRAINFHIVTQRSGMDEFLQKGGTQIDTTAVLGMLAFWLVILASLIIAFNGLGLSQVTELLGRIVLFVPRLVLALLILAFGAYFARFIGNAVSSYCASIGLRDGKLLGNLARYAIMVFVIVIAFDHLDFGGTILRTAFLIVLSGLILAFALAFGLGGREWAAARLEQWWPTLKRDRDT